MAKRDIELFTPDINLVVVTDVETGRKRVNLFAIQAGQLAEDRARNIVAITKRDFRIRSAIEAEIRSESDFPSRCITEHFRRAGCYVIAVTDECTARRRAIFGSLSNIPLCGGLGRNSCGCVILA